MAESKITKISAYKLYLNFTDIHSSISIHSTYREADVCGNNVRIFVMFTVSSAIPAWTNLFKITNTPKPYRLQRFIMHSNSLGNINTEGVVQNQESLSTGDHKFVFEYYS